MSDDQKMHVLNRYVPLAVDAGRRAEKCRKLFYALINIITISGVLIAAFMTINKVAGINQRVADGFYWTCFALSVLLTLSNEWLYVFNMNKQFVNNVALREKLMAEGWKFLAGIDKYRTDEKTRFNLFVQRIEDIQAKTARLTTEVVRADIQHPRLTGSDSFSSVGTGISSPYQRDITGTYGRPNSPSSVVGDDITVVVTDNINPSDSPALFDSVRKNRVQVIKDEEAKQK